LTRARSSQVRFVLCLDNDGYDASLDVRKVYRSPADSEADRLGLIRVIDESGEDYLYPKKLFALITLTPAIRRRLAR
jgi:hypothetical protein